MSIKSILAPFIGKETDESVATAALRIAKIFDAAQNRDMGAFGCHGLDFIH